MTNTDLGSQRLPVEEPPQMDSSLDFVRSLRSFDMLGQLDDSGQSDHFAAPGHLSWTFCSSKCFSGPPVPAKTHGTMSKPNEAPRLSSTEQQRRTQVDIAMRSNLKQQPSQLGRTCWLVNTLPFHSSGYTAHVLYMIHVPNQDGWHVLVIILLYIPI